MKISTFQTTPYTEDELESMTRDEKFSVKNYGYQKVIKETELVGQTFTNAVQLQNKVLELCQENEVLFVSVDNYTRDAFLVGDKYRIKDPNAIFEIMFFSITDKTAYTEFVRENIRNGITTDPCIKVILMVIGKELHKMTHYYSKYFKMHQLPSLSSMSNLIHDLPQSTWYRVDPSHCSQKEQLRLARQKLQDARNKKLDSPSK